MDSGLSILQVVHEGSNNIIIVDSNPQNGKYS